MFRFFLHLCFLVMLSVALTTARKKGSSKKQKGILFQEFTDLVKNLTQAITVLGECTTLPHSDTSQGSTIIHWGSRKCINNSKLIYRGFIGGSNAQRTVTAINNLCLPSEILRVSRRTEIYAVKWDSLTSYFGACAVCFITRSTSIMIPGKESCPKDWTIEYTGNLMAGQFNQTAVTEYICVAKMKDETVASNLSLADGGHLYPTTFKSGILSAPDVVKDNAIVRCVVCSK